MAVPRDWIASLGDIAKFAALVLYSLIKGMAMATMIVIVGAYYGYTARGGPVGVGTATARSMVFNVVGVHVVGMLGTQIYWGANPRAPIGG
ncbi:MAG TPA: ABC transporter permease [Thermoleophilaceae bacterium]|nr:ABC transporter permease [Thermoleophilaceae bacterium]